MEKSFTTTSAGDVVIAQNTNRVRLSDQRLHWGRWEDNKKVILNGKEYVQCGDMLYTRHAIENTYPSALGRVAGHTSNHAPTGLSPSFIKMIIDSPSTKIYNKVIEGGITRTVYETQNIRIVTEGKVVVTVTRRK